MTSRGSDGDDHQGDDHHGDDHQDEAAGLDPATLNQIAVAVAAAVAKERAEALAESKV